MRARLRDLVRGTLHDAARADQVVQDAGSPVDQVSPWRSPPHDDASDLIQCVDARIQSESQGRPTLRLHGGGRARLRADPRCACSAPPSSRVAHFIQAAIQSGDLAPGTKLPSQRKLAEAFEIAQNTAREAYRLLAERGLVVAEHGRGVFVVDRTGPAGFTPASGGQVCPTCGALVDVGAVGRHLRWHSLVAG